MPAARLARCVLVVIGAAIAAAGSQAAEGR
jgi:hypothetical protein